jgi:hypothetical protein
MKTMLTDKQRIEALINAGFLDEEGHIVPTASDVAKVNQEHPDASDADKFRKMQAEALIRTISDFYGHPATNEDYQQFGKLWAEWRNEQTPMG